MIEWYSLLFFAFTLVFLIIDKTSNHRLPTEYIMMRQQVGLSSGTYSLLIQFMMGLTFLFPLFLTAEFQLLSVFLLLLGTILLYIFLVKLQSHQQLMNAFLHLTNKVDMPYLLWIFALANIINLFVQVSFIAFLFQQIFQQPVILAVTIFLAFCFIYFGLGGYYGLNRIGSIMLYIIFFILSVTILIVFLNSGMHNVYEQYLMHQAFHAANSILNYLFSFITFSLIMIGQTCTSFYFWHSLTSIKEKHRQSALRYSIFSWGSFLVAILVLCIHFYVQMTHFDLSSLQQLLSNINPLFLHTVTYIIFMLLAVGIGNNIYSLISLYFMTKENRSKQTALLVKQGYLFGLIICVLLGCMAIIFYPSAYFWLPIALSFFTAASAPFILAAITGHFQQKAAFISIIMTVMINTLANNAWENIWLFTLICSITSLFLYLIIQKFKIVRT